MCEQCVSCAAWSMFLKRKKKRRMMIHCGIPAMKSFYWVVASQFTNNGEVEEEGEGIALCLLKESGVRLDLQSG